MLNRRRVRYGLITGASVCLLFGGLLAGFSGRGQTQGNQQKQTATILRRGQPSMDKPPTAKELDDAATPIVDFYDVTTPFSKERVAKNARYDKRKFVTAEPGLNVASIVKDREFGPSDIPIDRSGLVIEGRVTSASAFLSNDKGGVYSEFTVHVTDILIASTGVNVNPGDEVVAEREGGRIRYPDGRVIRYGFVGEGSPMKGGKYLFFLSQVGQGSYAILTAYEVRGNKVFALDGSRINDGLGRWSFDKHNGEDYEKLRKAVDDEGKRSKRGGRP